MSGSGALERKKIANEQILSKIVEDVFYFPVIVKDIKSKSTLFVRYAVDARARLQQSINKQNHDD